MQHTAEMVSKSFANPTLASKFFIVLDRSSSSHFTSVRKKKKVNYHENAFRELGQTVKNPLCWGRPHSRMVKARVGPSSLSRQTPV